MGASTFATTDVHYRDRNCGTALFKADTNRLAVETGDVGEDQFEQESLITNCDQLILERRFLAAAAGSRHGRRRHRRPPGPRHAKPAIPGDIFGSGRT
ncbi:MAG: hypothetical protein V9G12_19905 [Microthrixaceae bacterium]